ncbi:MAG: response regulator [Acidobacteria bacterium]|nr:MAG: response regulator [Acidobacteriota bacterium]
MKAVIVDDEEPARLLLREYLTAHPDVEIVAECANGFEAVKAVGEMKPDLMFLDIQMPKLNGFEVLELLDPAPFVVFVTAYDEYALRAFEVHALDYLLKPFGQDRFDEALTRVRERLEKGSVPSFAPLLKDAAAQRKWLDRVLIKDGSKVHVIPVDKIDYVEAQDDYVCFRSAGKEYLKAQSMNDLESLLDPARFIRIHRGYILNVERMARIELYAKDSRVVILQDGKQLPVSRTGYQRLRAMFGGEV